MATALVLNIWRWSRCCSGARAGCTRLAGEARAGAADTARPHCSGSGAGAAPFPLFRGDQRRRQDLHDDTACRVLWPAVCYTGIVSFADVMFFGFDAYGVSHMLYAPAASWGPVLLGLVAAAGLSLAIGLLSLRVQSIFLAMMMLAAAYAFNVLASQLSWLTRREDGRSFKVLEALQAGRGKGFRHGDHGQNSGPLSRLRCRCDRFPGAAGGLFRSYWHCGSAQRRRGEVELSFVGLGLYRIRTAGPNSVASDSAKRKAASYIVRRPNLSSAGSIATSGAPSVPIGSASS
jgi:hypothetical protein